MGNVVVCSRCGRSRPAKAGRSLGDGCPFCLLASVLTEQPDPEPRPGHPTHFEAGTHLGPYVILELLGVGGMGTVYKARHEGLDRVVALKVLHPDREDQPWSLDRFRLESQVLAALVHPNIVAIHDCGCEDGVFYLAMEHVEGHSLRETLTVSRLTPSEAVRLVAQVCDALQCAHDRGVMHRDVKPENILIGLDGRVKLADFGIAKPLPTVSTPAGSLTEPGRVAGTRAYMAPEQLEPGRSVDHRADLYSLGVVLYELLTGNLPLGVFPAPSRRGVVPQGIDGPVLRALEHDPDRRFQSAAEFREGLLSALDASPLRTARPTRRVGLRWAVAAGLLLLAAGLGVGGWRATRPPELIEPVTEPEHAASPRPTAPRTLRHPAKVWGVDFSPDGLLATTSEDKLLRLWDPVKEQSLSSLTAFPRGELGYLAVRFAPDGRTLATAGGDNVVRVWDRETRKELHTLVGHKREVNAVAFSPDGLTLASASHDQTVRLWDARTGNPVTTLTGHTDPVLAVAFSPDGRRLATSSMNGSVRFWDAETRQLISQFGHVKRVWSVAFSPDGKTLATGGHDQLVRCWNLTTSGIPPRKDLSTDGAEVWTVAYSADGKLLAAGCHDGIIRLWDAKSGQRLPPVGEKGAAIFCVSISADGRRLAAAGFDQVVRIWELKANIRD